jgi:UPF0148 protein
MNNEETPVKRMADLLKAGATMLFEHCPQCGSPLFKIQDEIWCATCDKKVLILKQSEAAPNTANTALFNDLETTVLAKLREVHQRVRAETDVANLESLAILLSTWLDVYEKIQKHQQGKSTT